MRPETKTLQVTFAPDAPMAAVEVVAPDFSVVKRVMMRGGDTQEIAVACDKVFLRISLPSGRTVTLPDRGSLSRTVTLESLNLPSLEKKHFELSDVSELAFGPTDAAMDARAFSLVPDNHWNVVLMNDNRQPVSGRFFFTKTQWSWQAPAPESYQALAHLIVGLGKKMQLNVNIPAHTRTLDIRHRLTEDEEAYRIRLTTSVESADTLLSFLSRGNLAAASSMSSWASSCEDLLMRKGSDPAGAAVGGYLLLKMGKYERLHDWPRNLAGDTDELRSADGAVIWASQLIAMGKVEEINEIKRYLFAAADSSLPVYTEGLRLLFEGLRLLGDDGNKKLEKLISRLGTILWESPLTAYLTGSGAKKNPDIKPVIIDIGLAAD